MAGLFFGFGLFDGGLFQPLFDLPGVVTLFKRPPPVDFSHELLAQEVQDVTVVNH